MSTYLSILFLVKRSKISSKGLCPIFMRLTISGKRLEFSVGRSIEPEKWCNDSGKLKGRSSEVRQVNNYLDLLKSRVHKIQQDFTFDKEMLTVQILKDKLFGLDQNKRMLLTIMKEHNDKMEKLIVNEYAKGTVIRYKSCYKHLQNFLKVKG